MELRGCRRANKPQSGLFSRHYYRGPGGKKNNKTVTKRRKLREKSGCKQFVKESGGRLTFPGRSGNMITEARSCFQCNIFPLLSLTHTWKTGGWRQPPVFRYSEEASQSSAAAAADFFALVTKKLHLPRLRQADGPDRTGDFSVVFTVFFGFPRFSPSFPQKR